MRKFGSILPVALLGVLALGAWGLWTYRLTQANRQLALQVENVRQRDFTNMAYHVQQIQGLLGKGLATGSVRQNMRYLSEANHHAESAVQHFGAIPLPAELSAGVGKFLNQVGDFADSVMKNEAAGRDMDENQRAEVARLESASGNLSAQLQQVMARYNQGRHRWSQPMRLSWANLFTPPDYGAHPPTNDNPPQSFVPGGFDTIGQTMQQLPTFVYDGPFSDNRTNRRPAMTGAAVTQQQAEQSLQKYLPPNEKYSVKGVVETRNNMPSYSFQLVPANATADNTGDNGYTTAATITKEGGFLSHFINNRMVGEPTIDLNRARELGQQYLQSIGYKGLAPTYGDAANGQATITYAYREGDVIVYPDQIKLKIAMDNGEILGVDARQYLMNHHTRSIGKPAVSVAAAKAKVNPRMTVQRSQLALIPNLAGTGEILTYEFLCQQANNTYLVYINAATGEEEQILQQIQTDGGTFAL